MELLCDIDKKLFSFLIPFTFIAFRKNKIKNVFIISKNWPSTFIDKGNSILPFDIQESSLLFFLPSGKCSEKFYKVRSCFVFINARRNIKDASHEFFPTLAIFHNKEKFRVDITKIYR